MKLLVAVDAHIFHTQDGRYWCKSIYSYDFFKRYLNIYDSIRIVSRVKEITCADENMLLVSGEGIEIVGIPFYQGPKQLAKKYFRIRRSFRGIYDTCDVALFRMPSQTAYMAYIHKPKHIPFAGEIVYDPNGSADDENDNILIKIYNYILNRRLKRFCADANGVSYVTEDAIQRCFPSYARIYGEDKKHFETYYSTIVLPESAYLGSRDYSDIKSLKLVISNVAMNSERKGEKTVIKAVKIARDRGYDVTAVVIGDGSKRKEFESYAEKLHIKEHIKFTGLLPRPQDVRKILIESDVYILPTKAEGLPRGILEAMAAGMPVLSSPVGGIPEIIDAEFLFRPLEAEAYADKICELLERPEKLSMMSRDNYEKSKEYESAILQKRRNEFYTKLMKLGNQNE
jgi:glycosyltransferase involved in cell wall biosynthesis